MTTTDGLVVENLCVDFGGVHAVADLSLRADPGMITGLIGPNGAGKSTTFNACSGFVQPTSGQVRYGTHELTDAPIATRAHVGIGRTFQRVELFDTLTVEENVSLGREAGMAGAGLIRQILPARDEPEQLATATQRALELCGIEHLRNERAGILSTGQKRLVELARALAGGFRLLLLDEPSSGLDVSESTDFAHLLRSVVDGEGIGMLLVEHDMQLIADVCDYVYVLDFGRLIFQGTADQVLNSPVVRAAYLGSEPVPTAGGTR